VKQPHPDHEEKRENDDRGSQTGSQTSEKQHSETLSDVRVNSHSSARSLWRDR